jgi:hypothetical protein
MVDLTANIVSSLYLSLQVEFIELGLTKDHLVMHQQAVHDTLQIQSVLRSPDSNTSLQAGAWKMAELGMYHEAARISGWVVRICRTLVKIDRELSTRRTLSTASSVFRVYS